MENRARTVLHVSPDRELAGSRGRVLKAIGCEVFWVKSESAALFEISMGRCGILLLCHKLSPAARESLADCFHAKCPEPFIVAILAHEGDHCPPRAHARVLFRADHGALAPILRQRLAAVTPQLPP
ncbi:MAG: hypothetical protein JOZ14_15705 [Acidobacteria bacterium]|nr:hypothetical protein [Acidobacteriota bacterium]